MSLKGTKEHVMGEYYGEIVRERKRPYCVQETITMLRRKGLSLDEAIEELPIYCQEEAREIYLRG
jgi:hypothetical protein